MGVMNRFLVAGLACMAFAASAGQSVSQADVIGYVGCTGHCYGDHLHFETRVNGVATDPLGYL